MIAPQGQASRAALSDADLRLSVGLGVLLLSGLPVRRKTAGPLETRLFAAVNGMSDRVRVPVWAVMQCGNVGAVPVTAALALSAGRRRLAVRMTVAGLSTWALAKLVKRIYRRPRPRWLVDSVHRRGPEQTGLGYVSGHAGIAVALGVASSSELSAPARIAVGVAMPVVGLSRMYIGAHLPLDVLGGAALGLAVDAVVAGALQRIPL